MNAFNRVLAIVVALALVGGGGLALLSRLGAAPAGVTIAPPTWTAWQAAMTAVVLGAGLALLAAELWTLGRRRRLLLKEDAHGSVIADMEGIEHLVAREATRIDGVRSIRSTVHQKHGELTIFERIAVAPDTNVTEVSRELQTRIRGAVEQHLGVPVAAVRVEASLAAVRR